MSDATTKAATVSALVALSSLLGLHVTSKYMDQKELQAARKEHKIQQEKYNKQLAREGMTKSDVNVATKTPTTKPPNYRLNYAARNDSHTYLSATLTSLFLVLIVLLSRYASTFSTSLVVTMLTIAISYQLTAAFRANKRKTALQSRQWREAAEEDRDVLISGLSLGVIPPDSTNSETSSTSPLPPPLPSPTTTPQVELPRWVSYPDVEKVTWFNILLRRWWPYLKANIADKIQQGLQPMLDKNRPAFMTHLGFEVLKSGKNYKGEEVQRVSLDFGTEPLKIVGIKTYDQTGEDSIVIDIGLSLHTIDSNIIFQVGVGGVVFKIGLHDLGFSARLRIEMLQLTTDPDLKAPLGIGAVQICFTQRPDISFDLSSPQVGGLNFTDIPMVHTFLTNFLKNTLAESMVLPRCIPIPLIDMDDAKMRDLATKPPNGVVVVRVIGARNLSHAKWYTNFTNFRFLHMPPSICSHYIKLTLGEQEKTTTCVMGTSPIFDQTFTLIVHSRDSHVLDFNVFAKRLAATHDIVGNASISVQSLKPNVKSIETVTISPLMANGVVEQRPGACVDFHATWMPVIPKTKSTPSGILCVELIAAYNLRGVNTIGGKSGKYKAKERHANGAL